MHAALRTPGVRHVEPVEPVDRSSGAVNATALAEQVDADGSSVCSVCGRSVAEDDVENSNGWRWYSNGLGGLMTLCSTCPALPRCLRTIGNPPSVCLGHGAFGDLGHVNRRRQPSVRIGI